MAVESTEKTGEKAFQKPGGTCDICPNCEQKLSPWQQVLLAIDRALVCKSCWYHIILDISGTENASHEKNLKIS